MARPSTILATLATAFVVGGLVGVWTTFHGATPGVAGPGVGTTADEPFAPTPGPVRASAPIAAPGTTQTHATRQPDGRIVISGTFVGAHMGDPVTVQRRKGGTWTDFPAATRTGPGGRFSLQVRTEHASDGSLRVRDSRTGAVSEPASLKS